ncbi:type II toxin-antitoxin system HicB family antitoxin [Hyphomonas sp.]|uniref:type II toxin-antitoxin system HicB family antitoxin n=1 Tax=Hyphomonas sp. TaxID=87 RepID=UPI00391E025D
MTRYFALVEQEGDSAYGVTFPDVAGCFSAADDEDDLMKNAIEALSLHLESQPLPPARSSAELNEVPDIRAAILAGAYLMPVPLIVSESRQVSANISLDKGMLKAIDAAARERGLTRSAFLIEAARHEIERR